MQTTTEKRKLTCSMGDCRETVTHIDNKGFLFCENHGIHRRNWHPCRKMLKREIAAIENGELISWKR